MRRTKLVDRELPTYTKGEEIFNMVSHILGVPLGIVAIVLCTIISAKNGNPYGIVGGAIYGASLILLYSISSIYHGLSDKIKGKKVLQILDHCSIFILIAGTYTPITLILIRSESPVWGWLIFGIVWLSAIIGITLNAIDLNSTKKVSMICYILMGWCIIFKFDILIKVMQKNGILLLTTGGVLYTIGAIFYGIGKKRKWFHSIFHLLVLAGSILQFFCIVGYLN